MEQLTLEYLECVYTFVNYQIQQVMHKPFSGSIKKDLEFLRADLIALGIDAYNYDLSGGGLLE